MAFDSDLAATLALLAAAVFSARPGTGNYLRFAAMLCAALAAALLSRAAGLGQAAALIVLPLAGVSLGLSALARTRRRSPPLAASLALGAGLAAGLFALLTGLVTAALLPMALGGVVMMLSGRVFTLLSGLLLLAAACAGLSAGLSAPLLMLLSASLFGAGLYRRVSSRRAVASGAP